MSIAFVTAMRLSKMIVYLKPMRGVYYDAHWRHDSKTGLYRAPVVVEKNEEEGVWS